jgi:surfactin synthase thioesterase subunit
LTAAGRPGERSRIDGVDAKRWLVAWPTSGPVQARVVCLGQAGAGAAAFRDWPALMPGVEVAAVRLPGRENRFVEPPLESLAEVVTALRALLAGDALPETVLVGICSGALVLFELARALHADGDPLPAGLVAVSQPAPSFAAALRAAPLSELPIRDALERSGYSDAAILESDEMMAVIEPAFRADLRLGEQYEYAPREPLPLPIAAVYSREDASITRDSMAAWASESSQELSLLELERGDHLFATDEGVRLLTATLARAVRRMQ